MIKRKTAIYPPNVYTNLQFWYQCLDCFNCTRQSCKNLQSTPFRPIVPSDETEVTPRASHMHFLDRGRQKYPHLNGTVLSNITPKISSKHFWPPQTVGYEPGTRVPPQSRPHLFTWPWRSPRSCTCRRGWQR